MDFWEAKRQELQASNQLPVTPAPSGSGVWWAKGTNLLPGPVQYHQQDVPVWDSVDGHDVSKASHIKGEGRCPECNSDGYFSPTTRSVRRCYFCGYAEGRTLHDTTQMRTAIHDGTAQRARQTANGGAVVNNYHGDITSGSQAEGRIT